MLLVVAAFEPELAPLRAALGERLGEHVVLAAVGIGLLEAPLGTIAALDRHQPESLLFVGTAGFYPPSTGAPLAIGDLVVARQAALAAPVGTELPAGVGDPLPASPLAVLSRAPLAALPRVSVATTPGVTVAERPPLVTGEHSVEHMELAAVFAAARARSVPAGALLAIANGTGPGGRADWLAHHRVVSATLASALAKALGA
jgi:nucleoside phosphorylase